MIDESRIAQLIWLAYIVAFGTILAAFTYFN
jgi:hypothetical protein